MTVDEAFDYITNYENNCNSSVQVWKSKDCDYANGLYRNANIDVQDKVLQDSIIQRLLIKAYNIDCYHTYPEPAVCVAVDIRANEIEMNVIRELRLSAKSPIFDVRSAFIQGKFNQSLKDQQTNMEAGKLLREVSESKSI